MQATREQDELPVTDERPLGNQPRQRESERVTTEVAVRVGDLISGVTRDISPSGVFFVIDEKLAPKQSIHFSIDFEDPTNNASVLHLECVGKVVRVEEVGGKCGVGVAITESHLERRAK